MCSGLTAYAALKRLAAHAGARAGAAGRPGRRRHDGARDRARACSAHAPIVADIDAGKARGGARRRRRGGLRSGRPRGAARRCSRRTGGGVFAACDFVGSDQSLAFATGALAKGGKVVVTGLLGGTFPLPVAMFVLKAMTDRRHADRHARRGARADGAGPRREAHAAADRRNARSPKRRPRSTTCAPAAWSGVSCWRIMLVDIAATARLIRKHRYSGTLVRPLKLVIVAAHHQMRPGIIGAGSWPLPQFGTAAGSRPYRPCQRWQRVIMLSAGPCSRPGGMDPARRLQECGSGNCAAASATVSSLPTPTSRSRRPATSLSASRRRFRSARRRPRRTGPLLALPMGRRAQVLLRTAEQRP